MKRHLIFNAAKRVIASSAMLLATALFAFGNTTETVEQVSGKVSLTADVDYVITSATPFAAGATIDIVNTDKATVIFKSLKPSQLSKFYGNILINGVKATTGNCQARIHADGAILLPYNATAPLTVYSEKDQQGESATFNVSTRQSLAKHVLNNRIQSFTLKRGYMAWFATKADGRGYNRVFIADKEPLTVNLPTILSNSISSLRVSQWNDASKKGYAGWDPAYNDPLNTTWCYSWDAGINIWTDREYVTQHHHEGWPGITDVGNNGTSANILGNNEPDNTGDDREQVNSVADVLKTWPEMMATGRRLGSPAMASNLSWLYEFFDSIDARGWRCDFVVMHCYWLSDWPSWKSTLQNVRNRTGRPVWITEMNYGANWTGWPGSDRTGSAANYAIQAQHMNPVIDGLEETPWLERYAIYNWVEDCRKVIDGNMKLTPFGEYYANKPSAVAYDSKYEVVPKLPKMYGPSDFEIRYDSEEGVATLSWYEPNGEYNESMTIQRSADGNKWEDYAEISFEESGSKYEYKDSAAVAGHFYRLHIIDANGKNYITRSLKTVPNKIAAGMPMSIGNKVMYAGGNRFINGDFDLGLMGWTAGDGTPLSEPYFQAVPVGGVDGGAYLQAYGHGGTTKVESILNVFDIEANADYYVSGASYCEAIPLMRICLTSGDNKEDQSILTLNASTNWLMQSANFNSGDYTKLQVSLRSLGAGAQVDNLTLCRLFETKEEAMADAYKYVAIKAQAMAAFLEQDYPSFSAELRELIASTTDYETLNALVNNIVLAYKHKSDLEQLCLSIRSRIGWMFPENAEVQELLDKAENLKTVSDIVETYTALRALADNYFSFENSVVNVANGSFATGSASWNVKCGTYTGGDQRVATHGTKTAWNAWWSGLNASEGKAKTMEINQEVSGKFGHGLYVLECKASTQHYCLSDQKAYMINGTDTVYSSELTAQYLDLPTVSEEDKWQTLQTAPIYLNDNDTVTVGFVGSKSGATDNKWWRLGDKTYAGDNREGWWCATDFVLRYSPLYRVAVPSSGWGVICLPKAITVSANTHLYNVVGISSDYQSLCLEEVAQGEAGVPYVYYTTDTIANFFETGEAVTTAVTTDANLRGNFVTSSRVPRNGYQLQNGTWVRITSSTTADRPKMESYSGIFRKLVGMPVLKSWDGKTMPVIGAADEYSKGASNSFVLNDTTINAGKTLHLPVAMQNESSVASFQCDVYLSEGITLLTNNGSYDISLDQARADNHNVTSVLQEDGSVRINASSLNNTTFSGNNGNLFYLNLKTDRSDLTDFTITLKNIQVTDVNGNRFDLANVSNVIKFSNSTIPGDVNGDGEIVVNDVVYAINYILGDVADNFVFEAADMNGDGEIVVDDVVQIINAVLGVSATSEAPMHRAEAQTSTDKFYINDFTIAAGEKEKQLAIQLESNNVGSDPVQLNYVAFQFDIYLPEGLTIDMKNGKYNFALAEARKDDHTLTFADQADGAIRVLGASLSNGYFWETKGDFITFSVTAVADFSGAKELYLKKVMFSTKDGKRSELADVTVKINDDPSGIENVSSETGINGNIYNVQGQKVREASNTNSLPRGLYIINGKKFVVN